VHPTVESILTCINLELMNLKLFCISKQNFNDFFKNAKADATLSFAKFPKQVQKQFFVIILYVLTLNL